MKSSGTSAVQSRLWLDCFRNKQNEVCVNQGPCFPTQLKLSTKMLFKVLIYDKKIRTGTKVQINTLFAQQYCCCYFYYTQKEKKHTTLQQHTKNSQLKYSVINETFNLYSDICSLSHCGRVINGPVAGPQTTLSSTGLFIRH